MLDDTVVPNWVARIIEDIEQSSAAKIVLYILRAPEREPPVPFLRRLVRGFVARWRTQLFTSYVNWDYRKHRAEPDAFAPRDLSQKVSSIDTLAVSPITNKWSDRLTSTDLEAVRQRELDVILRFGFRILRGPILSAARYGIWSYHHGDNRFYRGGPAFFWEVFRRDPVCGTILQRLTERLDYGDIIHRSISATNPTSLYATRNAAYWKAAGAVRRRLEDLASLGWDRVAALYPRDPAARPGRLYRTPGPLTVLLFLARLRFHALAEKTRGRIFHEKWAIGFRTRSADLPWTDRRPFTFGTPPDGHFYADPFLVTHMGRTSVFFEDFVSDVNKGRICCAEVTRAGVGTPEVALESDTHLAYPYVFAVEGKVYMTPESTARRRVELWQAMSFPNEWRMVKVLIDDVIAVDPTLVRLADEFWLFVGIAPSGAASEHELHAFHARDLFGSWVPHPRNPLSSDIRNARPAGRPFQTDDGLIRPGQDCSVRYGRAITLSLVDQLSRAEFSESPFERITAPAVAPRAVAAHTYDRNEDFEVVDAVIRRWSLRPPDRVR